MKNIYFTIIIALSAVIVSCGPSHDQQKKKSEEDSIKKIDSITNLLSGNWRGKNNYSITITKTGKIFTAHYGNNSGNEGAAAYTLDGQILKPVDNSDSPISLIEDKKILYKGSVYTKNGSDDSDVISGSKTSKQSSTSSSPTTTKTSSSSPTSSVNITSSPVSVPNELTIITTNIINMHQRPSNSSLVLQGLSNGQVCKIIKKGSKAETINGKTDYWYEVKGDGEDGWVFGAFTSLHQ
jgi:hypothetical protein